jgi:Planctomycete cytochrome C
MTSPSLIWQQIRQAARIVCTALSLLIGFSSCQCSTANINTPISVDEPVTGQSQQEKDAEIDRRAIQLLKAKCANCHGAELAEGNLKLDNLESAQRGGDRGPAIDLVTPDHSLLLISVSGKLPELEMPPKNPLTQAEIDLLQQWLRKGARWIEPIDQLARQ